jgi:hypothetical protein
MDKKNKIEGFKAVEKLARRYLNENGYDVEKYVGDRDRGTLTYLCKVLGIFFHVKLVVYKTQSKKAYKRKELLENEIAAFKALWLEAPEGEFDSFMLPPGPEDVFDEEFEGYNVFGYTRLHIDGDILGEEFRLGEEKPVKWTKKFAEIVHQIDTLPQMELPHTGKKDQQDFQKTIIKNTRNWAKGLTKEFELDQIGAEENLKDCIDEAVIKIKEYFAENRPVLGTAHCNLTPDHIVKAPILKKPYIVNFNRLNQSYPRFFDVAIIYSWLVVVLGTKHAALDFWVKAVEKLKVGNSQLETLEMITNEILLGTLYNFLKFEKEEVKIQCDDFWI